jgi:large subunit ribosomal protein L10
MARPEKVAEVATIATKLQGAQSIVLADFTGLSVAQLTEFRSKCREQAIECRVVKNRLARIAADNIEMAVIRDHFNGPTALILDTATQVGPAKIVVDFQKENEALTVKGGILDGRFLDAKEIVALSKVPSKDELIARMMGSINSPLTGLAMTVNAVVASLARAIDAVGQQKAEAAAN